MINLLLSKLNFVSPFNFFWNTTGSITTPLQLHWLLYEKIPEGIVSQNMFWFHQILMYVQHWVLLETSNNIIVWCHINYFSFSFISPLYCKSCSNNLITYLRCDSLFCQLVNFFYLNNKIFTNCKVSYFTTVFHSAYFNRFFHRKK
jgi:hypothetical protein